MLKRYLYDKETTIVVAVMEEQDIAVSDRGSTYAGNMVGYAIWERMGRVKAKKRTLWGSVNSMFGSSTVSPWLTLTYVGVQEY